MNDPVVTTEPVADPRPPFTRAQRQALDLLARGGARYGTRISVMKELKDMGLCCPHEEKRRKGKGRWTWRPTALGWETIKQRRGCQQVEVVTIRGAEA